MTVSITRVMTLLTFCLSTHASVFADGLSEILQNEGSHDEAYCRGIASVQASSGPTCGSTSVEHRSFVGYFRPAAATTQLAIFSDDGCDVSINGARVLNRLNNDQALDNPGSFTPLAYTFDPAQTYRIQVDYSNTIHTGPLDLDGLTLFVYAGGGSEVDTPLMVDLMVDGMTETTEDAPGFLLEVGSEVNVALKIEGAGTCGWKLTFPDHVKIFKADGIPLSSGAVQLGESLNANIGLTVKCVDESPNAAGTTITATAMKGSQSETDTAKGTVWSFGTLKVSDSSGAVSTDGSDTPTFWRAASGAATFEQEYLPSNLTNVLPVLFKLDGTGSSPANGPINSPAPTDVLFYPAPAPLTTTLSTGADINSSGLLDAGEVKRSVIIRQMSFEGAKLKSARMSAPSEEFFEINSGEHYEVGGQFRFQLDGSQIGTAQCVTWKLKRNDGWFSDSTVAVYGGPGFTRTFSSSDVGELYINVYADANGNSSQDGGEMAIASSYFQVKMIRTYNLNFHYDDRLGAFEGTANAVDVCQQKLNKNTLPSIRKDSQDDYRACISLNAASAVPYSRKNTLNPTGLPSFPCLYSELELHYALPFEISAVQDIKEGEDYNIGVSLVGGQRIVVAWSYQTDTTIVHEMLHAFGGLTESAHDTDPMRIFCRGGDNGKDDNANKLSSSQAELLDSLD